MAVTGWKYAGTAANVDNGGPAWTNPDYAKADDTSYADVTGIKSTTSDWLRLTNFGFTSSDIPDGSAINGIEIVVGRYASTSNIVTDVSLYLYDNGQVGNNLASATKWPGSAPAEATYGGATNMCGTSLAQTDIVASTFGVQLTVRGSTDGTIHAYVDYIKIRVYYTEGGASVKPYYYYLNQ